MSKPEILILVRVSPGLTTLEIGRALGRSHATARYHLSKLESKGSVVSERWGNTRRWFPPQFDEWERRVTVLFESRGVRGVLSGLSRSESGSVRSISWEGRVSRWTALQALERLRTLGFVSVVASGGRRRYLLQVRPGTLLKSEALLRKLPPDHPSRSYLLRILPRRTR